jgi:hypothetical protein
MSEIDGKQVRRQIAANGFTEAVERHGFRKVSPTHWQRDSEEVTWRVALVDAGYKRSPGCFHAVMGGLVHGLDDLAKKVDGKPISSPIRGLVARAHVHRDVGFNLYGDYHQGKWEPFANDLPESIRHPKELQIKYCGLRVDRLPEGKDLFDSGQVIKHWGRAGTAASTTAFLVEDRDIRAVAETVACYFELLYAHKIDRWMNFREIYDDFYQEDAPLFWPQGIVENICAAKLRGDIDQIHRMVIPTISRARLTADDFDQELADDPLTADRIRPAPELLRPIIVKNLQIDALYWAEKVVRACESLSISLPKAEIDFDQIEVLRDEVYELERLESKRR